MKKPTFELVPTPEYAAEIERIAKQWEGFERVGIYAYADTQTLVIQAQHRHKEKVVRTWVDVRINNNNIEEAAALLTAKYYHKLVEALEPDFIPVENF